jgi:hypothetical protein
VTRIIFQPGNVRVLAPLQHNAGFAIAAIAGIARQAVAPQIVAAIQPQVSAACPAQMQIFAALVYRQVASLPQALDGHGHARAQPVTPAMLAILGIRPATHAPPMAALAVSLKAGQLAI